MNQPFRNFYCVVKDKLLAGEYPGDTDEKAAQAKIDDLIKMGVTAFIDLTETGDGLLPYAHLLESAKHAGISYQRFPIRDVSVPSSRKVTKAILNAIDHHIENGGMVYVHCWGGVGRTGVVIGCWLARHGNGGQSAMTELCKLWAKCPKSVGRKSPETEEQERYILSWQESTKDRSKTGT